MNGDEDRLLSMKTSSSSIPAQWAGWIVLAGILLVISGCKPSQVPISPTSNAALASLPPLPISTAISPTLTNSSIPTVTLSLISSPMEIFLPLPKAVPIEEFQPPMVENMQTGQLFNGTWTTYTAPEWVRQSPQSGVSQAITSIAEAPAGTFWFSTTGSDGSGGIGVYRFDGKTWTRFWQANGLPLDEVFPIVAAPDGAIWFGSFCCGVSRYDGKSWTNYTTDDGLPSNDVRSLAFTADGALWVGTPDKGLARFDGKSWQTYTTQNGMWGNYEGPFFTLPDRTLLVNSSNDSYDTDKLFQFDGQGWVKYPTPWTDKAKYTAAMAASPNGDVWFATEFTDVYRLSGKTWTIYHLGSDNMLVGAAVARDGSAWFGTYGGAYRFDGKYWTTFKPEGDSGNNWVGSILAASDGSIWLAYYGGIAHYLN